MTGIESLIIEADDAAATQRFIDDAFGLDGTVTTREGQEATSGFRGFSVSLVCSQPADVDSLAAAALAAGATEIKPVSKSLWGYGGSLRAPDGTVWTLASSSKKNTGPSTGRADQVVLLLGVDDVAATKTFYTEQGFAVGKSFGRKYVEFDTPGAAVTLAVQSRRAVAKNAGVDAAGSGSHRLVIVGTVTPFTDPDGYRWE